MDYKKLIAQKKKELMDLKDNRIISKIVNTLAPIFQKVQIDLNNSFLTVDKKLEDIDKKLKSQPELIETNFETLRDKSELSAKEIKTKLSEIASEVEKTKEIKSEIEDLKNVIKKKDFRGPKGKDGLNGKDGKDGRDGVDGKDGRNGVDGITTIINKVRDIEGSEIVTKINGIDSTADIYKIDAKHIKNLPLPIIENSSTVNAQWGSITGDINNQADLQAVLDNKMDVNGLNSNVDKLKFNTTPTLGTIEIGETFWDETNHTLSTKLSNDVTLQHGQEVQIYARNNSGATIPNGSIVYQTGVVGGHPTIAKAIATTEATTYPLAVTTQDIPNNTFGYCTDFGRVRDLNTNSLNENDELFLSATVAGAYTTTPPASPNFVVKIGSVIVKNPANGEILVNIQNPLSNNNNLGISEKFGATQNAIKKYVDNAVSATSNTLLTYIDQSGGTGDSYGVLSGLVNGSNTIFTVSQSTYNSGSLKVYLNGQLQTQGSNEDWVETNPAGGVFTFNVPPQSGDLITVTYQKGVPDVLIENIVLTKTIDYTITGTEATAEITILCSNSIIITLPTAVAFPNRFINIKNVGTGTIIVEGNGIETIDGELNKTILFTNSSMRLTSDTTNWVII